MINKKYFLNKKNITQKLKISLIKSRKKPGLILPYSLQIKNNSKTNLIISKEINIRDVLNNMLLRTNKLYEYLDNILNEIKLENEQYRKRTEIIKNIKYFIEVNITIKNSDKTKDLIFCEIIYFFDLLIIFNKKCKNIISFEKLGLGALILVLKFNKLHEKILIKKYKSIFNDKYMTLDEINKIELVSLKMINYDIAQPNPIYYIDLLFKNIFLAPNDIEQNIYIYKQIISIMKYIMTFSNNYFKFHPFYFSTFIIKCCLEKSKIDKFHTHFIYFFEINMREYRTLYDEFLKTFQGQINTLCSSSKQNNENISKNKFNNSLKYNSNSSIDLQINAQSKDKNNFASISVSSGFYMRKCKKNKDKINNNNSMKLGMNSMNNTYYKKFLENYIGDTNNNINNYKYNSIDENGDKVCKIISIPKIDNKNHNSSIESPKNCGISINYRIKKKSINNINYIPSVNKKELIIFNYQNKKVDEDKTKIKKNINISMEFTSIKKDIKAIISNEKDDKNIKSKRLNSEIVQNRAFYERKGDSIRKIYKNKIKEKNNNTNNMSNNLINNKKEETKNNNIEIKEEKLEKIKVNTLNKMTNLNLKKSNIISKKEKKHEIYNEIYLKSNAEEALNFKRLRNTVNQSESSLVGNKDNNNYNNNNCNKNRDNDARKVRRINIRNFYKNKNLLILKYNGLDKKELLIN